MKKFFFLLLLFLSISLPSFALENESFFPTLLLVGDPGNSPDSNGKGAYPNSFLLSETITVAQWAFFLNSVYVNPDESDDPRHLYHHELAQEQEALFPLAVTTLSSQETEENSASPTSISWIYSPKSLNNSMLSHISSFASLPMTFISLEDAKRYCNWKENGSPYAHNLQEALAATESGSYDFREGKKGEPIAGATYTLPTEDQLYKAMYYRGGGTDAGYWDYPFQNNNAPVDLSVTDTFSDSVSQYYSDKKEGSNSLLEHSSFFFSTYYSHYNNEAPYLTPVGYFNASLGNYGHHDLGGNVRTWTSSEVSIDGLSYILAMGGSYEEQAVVFKRENSSNERFLSKPYPTIGMRIVSTNLSEATPFIKEGSTDNPWIKTISEGLFNFGVGVGNTMSSTSFWTALGNIAFTQISTYFYEFLLNALYLAFPELLTVTAVLEALPLIQKAIPFMIEHRAELLAPFTLPRNLVNTFLSIFNAAAVSATSSAVLNDDSWWSIMWLSVASIGTLLLTETAGAAVEAPIAAILNFFNLTGGTPINATTGYTLPRLLLNVYYILVTTYLNVGSALDQLHQQQAPAENTTASNEVDQNNSSSAAEENSPTSISEESAVSSVSFADFL